MLTFHKYEGKTKEIVDNKCSEDLGLTETYYSYEEYEAGLFKGKKIVLTAITKNEIISAIKSFLKDLSLKMNIEINSEITISSNLINIIIVSDNNNILIGKDGKTLNAIQTILRTTFAELSKFDLKLMLDISNYREKKIKSLENQIKKICNDVSKSKIEVKLDPMNSYQRRIVHEVVSKYENLKSESFGTEPNRYTVIKYNEN